MKPLVAITVGDFNGIGPEIALKAAAHASVKKICSPVLVGPLPVFLHALRRSSGTLKLEKSNLLLPRGSTVPVIDVGDAIEPDIEYGAPAKASGRNAGIAIERAVELCVQEKVSAMVTSPVSKEALTLAGYNFPGQTEMIALLSRSQQVAMLLVSAAMRVGLVTIHTALKNVAAQISAEKILEKIRIIDASLRKDFRLNKPRIAVLALNPHAGEHGVIGTEDGEWIVPAIAQARDAGIVAEGPFSADAFFGTRAFKQFDAIIAMYHDQGLIPLKMSSFGTGVNYSAGLKIVRTSPDHGTAYDIAGKNKASITSMIEAVKLAVRIAQNRSRSD